MSLSQHRSQRQRISSILFWFAFCTFFLNPICSNGQAASYNFRHLTDAEGLSDGETHAFVEDKYGFIWIGTSYGLNRFDGITVKSYFSQRGDSTSLLTNDVRCLYRDSHQNIWIGVRSGVCRYDDRSDQFIQYPITEHVSINAILEDKNGVFWF